MLGNTAGERKMKKVYMKIPNSEPSTHYYHQRVLDLVMQYILQILKLENHLQVNELINSYGTRFLIIYIVAAK